MSPQKYFKEVLKVPGLASCLSPLLSATIIYPPKELPRMRCNSELPLNRPPAPQHYVFHQFTCRIKAPKYPLIPRCLSPRAVYSEPDPIFCYPLTPQILILCLLKLMVCYHPNPPSPDLCSECFLHCLCPYYPEVSASPTVTLTGDISSFHRARGG